MPPTMPSPYLHTVTARCTVCRKGESDLPEGTKMKRCAGCSMTTYCSKECQKEGWARHKIACRAKWVTAELSTTATPGPRAIAEEPSESVAAVMAALEAWEHAHSYALMTIATTTVCQNGGFKLHFSTPRLIVLHLQIMSKDRYNLTDGNPAEGFHITHAESQSRDALQEMSGDPSWTERWELWQSRCRDLEKLFHEEGPNRALVGVLPAVFVVNGSPAVSISQLPVRRVPSNWGETLDADARALFEDIKLITIRAVGFGLVLQSPILPLGRLPPQVGTMVRQKKREWLWQLTPMFWKWIVTPEAPEILPLADLKTGLDITEIWARFLYGNPARSSGSSAGSA